MFFNPRNFIQYKFWIWRALIHGNDEIYPTHAWPCGTCIMSWCHGDVSKPSTLLKSNLRASEWSHLQSKVFNSQGLLTPLSCQIPETVFLSSCCSHLFISFKTSANVHLLWAEIALPHLCRTCNTVGLKSSQVYYQSTILGFVYLCQTRLRWRVSCNALKPIVSALVNAVLSKKRKCNGMHS